MTAESNTPLFRQVTDSTDISIHNSNGLVTLHFNNGLIQSQINPSHPQSLPLKGNRMMLAHLMFDAKPENILLAGCGGGSIGLWFNAHLPAVHGIAIEKSETIIQLARQYFNFPPVASNWRIQQADIQDFLATSTQLFDFILFDIEEQGHTPQWLTDKVLLENCRTSLSDRGVASFNIVARNVESFAKALWPIRQAFPKLTCCLGNPDNNNIIVLAFNSKPSLENLAARADVAKKRFEIEFDLFYQQLLKDNPPNSGIF